jgi:CRP-like cAMP-binding protein
MLFRQGDDADGVYCIQSGLIGLRRRVSPRFFGFAQTA